MANRDSTHQNTVPHRSRSQDDYEIPFAPDGNAPLIAAYVEKVKGVTELFQGLRCVRKTVPVDLDTDANSRAMLKQKLIQEAKILYLARHNHVVKLIHTYFEDVDGEQMKFAVIMDRADSNLQFYLEPGKLPAPQWLGCLVSVVRHIHGLGIRHRDIKPTNVLIKDGKILLADFGISQMGLGKTMPTTYQYRKPSRSREYCAPEVDNGSTRGRSADIFSLGAVFLEMLVALNDPEYSKQLNVVLRASSGLTASYSKHADGVRRWIGENFHPPGWQQGFSRVCQTMLDPDRNARPSAEDIYLLWSCSPFADTSMLCRCIPNVAPTGAERLIEVCQRGSEEELKALLAEDAHPAISDAIHYAAARGSVLMVQALIDAGAEVDTPNHVGQTALQCAARNGSLDVVCQLLKTQADVNARDENDQTALHGAAAQGFVEIVAILLAAKADSSAEDIDGRTAYQIASRRHHMTVLALLKDY
ncbi:hypothetical protein LTR86_011079 [Recurvomyces mirabilis]|nr:hypothetical protein LTR86_011079 [Recurvomyces mirabilis]